MSGHRPSCASNSWFGEGTAPCDCGVGGTSDDLATPTEVPHAKEPCPRCRRRMAKAPQGYVAWHEWAERMARRYDCEQCRDCGRWTIWRRR